MIKASAIHYLSGNRYSFRQIEIRDITATAGYIREFGMPITLYTGITGKRPQKTVWTYAAPDDPNRYWHIESAPDCFVAGELPVGVVFRTPAQILLEAITAANVFNTEVR